jgi:hypothetical protein
LIAAASVTEMMVMITLRDAQSSIVERDHWSIDFVARTHLYRPLMVSAGPACRRSAVSDQ